MKKNILDVSYSRQKKGREEKVMDRKKKKKKEGRNPLKNN